jgi:hypothetical protein
VALVGNPNKTNRKADLAGGRFVCLLDGCSILLSLRYLTWKQTFRIGSDVPTTEPSSSDLSPAGNQKLKPRQLFRT